MILRISILLPVSGLSERVPKWRISTCFLVLWVCWSVTAPLLCCWFLGTHHRSVMHFFPWWFPCKFSIHSGLLRLLAKTGGWDRLRMSSAGTGGSRCQPISERVANWCLRGIGWEEGSFTLWQLIRREGRNSWTWTDGGKMQQTFFPPYTLRWYN